MKRNEPEMDPGETPRCDICHGRFGEEVERQSLKDEKADYRDTGRIVCAACKEDIEAELQDEY